MRAVQILLAIGGRPGANDPESAFLWFRLDDDHAPAIDGADRDEPVLALRMLRVEDLEVVDARLEERLGFPEGESVLPSVAPVLRRVPLELHSGRV